MTFSEWEYYDSLLAGLESASTQWSGAQTFETFDGAVRGSCASLVEGDRGYADLITRLEASGDYSNREELFRHLRIVLLAAPAQRYGLGPEWAGYWISRDHQGAELYAERRFAARSAWYAMELPVQAASLRYDEQTGLMYDATNWYLRDGKTVVWPDQTRPGTFVDAQGNAYVHGEPQVTAVPVTAADPREQHFDEASGRWRRYVEHDGEYEYHHTEDGVWERARDGQWYRLHDGTGEWLPASAAAPPEPVVKPDAPPEPVAKADAEERDDDVVLDAMATEFEAIVTAVRELGIADDELSDDELFELFQQRSEQLLAAEVPELGQLTS